VRWLFAGLVALVASVGVALFALPDPGYVLIGFGKYSLETTLLVFVVVLAVVYVSLRMLAGLWHVPARVRRWNYRRESRRQRKLFDGAVIELVEGRPERAERRLARLAYSSETPLDIYLSAARVANQIGAQDRRDYYLKLALERNPKAEIAIALVQAELQLAQAQFDQAQTTLTHLRALAPRNSQVVRLLMQLYLRQKDWQQLRILLPELQRSRVLNSEQWQRLATQVYREQILELGASRDLDGMKSGWNQLPSSLQQDEGMQSVYVQELLRQGQHAHAEHVLRDQLRHAWNSRFVYTYGDITAEDAAAQLSVAESWLDQHPDDPVLLLTLGKISLRNALWGKARSYLESSIAHQPTPEAYRLLGSLLEQLEEPEKAAACYRQGIELVAQGLPAAALTERAGHADSAALLERPA
jgi:HemY protein